MPYWLKRLLIWKGHLLLWGTALIGLFWLLLVLTFQFLGSRPQSLYTLAELSGVQLTIGQFAAKTRPLASAVDFSLDQVHLAWQGGQLDIDHLAGDISLWNLLSPDLAIGKQMRIQQLKLVLETDAQNASASNPLATPLLRIWEDTHIQDSQVVWQADSPWMMDHIDIQVMRHNNWHAQFMGIMHYPGWAATPVTAQASIKHSFGFYPQIQFEGNANPGEMLILGQHYDFKLALQGSWNKEALQADLTIDAQTQTAQGRDIQHHVLGHLQSDDLLLWDLTVQQLSLDGEQIILPVWPRLTLHPQTGAVLALNQVRLTADGHWLKGMPDEVQQVWRLWQPELWLNQLSLHWGNDGALDAIRGGIDLLRWLPTEGIPGMDVRQLAFDYQPKDGRLEVMPRGESKLLWSTGQADTLPITASPLVLRLNPERPFSDWSLPSWQIKLGAITLDITADIADEKPMQVQVSANTNKLTDVLTLLPMSQFSAPLQQWLTMALKSGQDVQAVAHFHGHLSQLLSGELNDDNFYAHATAKEVTLLFDKDYPPLTHANGRLSWQQGRLSLEADDAMINGAHLEQVKAEVIYLANDKVALRVNGEMRTDLSQVPLFLLSSPLAKELDIVDLIKDTELSGAARGRLSLWIPLDGFVGDEQLPRVRGMLTTQSAQMNYAAVRVNHLSGRVLFSDRALEAPKLSGQWQGGDIQARISTRDKGVIGVKLTASTPINQADISRGILDWHALVNFLPNGKIDIQADGDQKRLAIDLPNPFKKSIGEERPWQLQAKVDKGLIQGLVSDSNWRIDTSLDANKSRWQILGLTLSPVASKHEAQDGGVDIQLPHLSLTDWLSWLETYQSESASFLSLPTEGKVSVAKLIFNDQRFNQVNGYWVLRDDTGRLDFSSEYLAGQFSWTAKDARLNLDKLRWQRKVNTAAEKLNMPLPVCQKPSSSIWKPLQVNIQHLLLETEREGVVSTARLSQVSAHISQEGQTRYARKIAFQSASVLANAEWRWQLGDNQSQLTFSSQASKTADLLALWGMDKTVSGGGVDLDVSLAWAGGMDCFDVRTLNGQLKARADDGSLLDTSPGFVRLLGLLSFDAFTRRLKIGLDDVVNKGLAFDKVEANASVSKGVLHVDHLQLDGPSVHMLLKGDTDLVSEMHLLDAQVTPLIGDSIPTMALLSGASPITAIGVYLLQKIVPPLSGNLFAFDYHIMGSWQEPELTEVIHE